MNSNSFFIILPSNTKEIGFDSNSVNGEEEVNGWFKNRPNRFKVRLPRKPVLFDTSGGGVWLCGLHSIVYPNR